MISAFSTITCSVVFGQDEKKQDNKQENKKGEKILIFHYFVEVKNKIKEYTVVGVFHLKPSFYFNPKQKYMNGEIEFRKKIAKSPLIFFILPFLYIKGVEGSFYISCTLDTRLDVIRQCLVQAFSKKEVGSDALQNGFQSTILPLPVCAQTLSPKSKGSRYKAGLFSVSTAKGTFLQFLSHD